MTDFDAVLRLIHFVDGLKAMTDDELANALLDHSPVLGALAHVCEAAAERLSPGILERRGDLTPDDQPKDHRHD